MKEPGFAYAGTLDAGELQKLLGRLRDRQWLSWNLAHIGFGRSIRDSGAAFNARCEIRWQRIGEDAFRVLVLSDNRLEGLPLPEVGGEWSTEEAAAYLIPLDSPQYNPPFHRYPVADSPRARLRGRVFYQDGVARFVSAREVTTGEE